MDSNELAERLRTEDVIVSPRGGMAEFNPSQVPLGRALRGLLDAVGIPAVALERLDEVGPLVDQAARSCFSSGQIVALVVSTLLSGGKRE